MAAILTLFRRLVGGVVCAVRDHHRRQPGTERDYDGPYCQATCRDCGCEIQCFAR